MATLALGEIGQHGRSRARTCRLERFPGKATCVLIFALWSQLLGATENYSSGRLDLDLNPSCKVGGEIVARHPFCWNATVEPWFPATVTDLYLSDGDLEVKYGYGEEQEWTSFSRVLATKAFHFPCRDEGEGSWEKGEDGRGFKNLPECGPELNTTACALGCRVIPSIGCLQGERFEFGEVCTTRCPPGFTPSRVNITCDLDLPARLRTFQCREGVDDDTTLTTTLFMDLDLRGCSEITELRPGELSTDPSVEPLPVGMPNLTLASGGVYFEVQFEGPHEQIGWVDATWVQNPGLTNQWMSPHARKGDTVGVAVRALEDGIADMWFAKNGAWDRKQGKIVPTYLGVVYEPPLFPVALLRGRAHFILPEWAWYRGPPPGGFIPFTRRSYPEACLYPPTYMLFENPARCGPGFEQLNTSRECHDAAFMLGLRDRTPLLGQWSGWPGGCFLCLQCDLSGNLYLNTDPSPGNNTVDMMRTPPKAAAVCRRFDPRSTTTTTTTLERVFISTTLMPPLYMRTSGRHCGNTYQPILSRDDCEAAAVWLDLYDISAQVVELGSEDVDEDSNEVEDRMHWPAGCFYCLACDNGQLYFNLDNSSLNSSLEVEAKSADAGEEPRAGTYVIEPVCRAPSHILTTLEKQPEVDTTTEDLIISTTEAVEVTTSAIENIYFSSSTTEAAVRDFGILTCDDPWEKTEEIPWWQRLEIMIGGGALGVICCCCPLLAWFFGVCDNCCAKIKKKCCGCCRCCKCCKKKPRQSHQDRELSEEDEAELEAEKELQKILGLTTDDDEGGKKRSSRRSSRRASQQGDRRTSVSSQRRSSKVEKKMSEQKRKSMTPAVAALDAALDEEGNWSEPDDDGPAEMALDRSSFGRESAITKKASIRTSISIAEAFGGGGAPVGRRSNA